MTQEGKAGPQNAGNFDLQSFFPYQVRIYYRAVSESVNAVYGSMYGLSVSEWRTMAVLGIGRAMSATEIVERSSMGKVNVSRAIKSMRASGLLKRDIDGDDRRRAVLRLTARGEEVLKTLVPEVLALEESLLEGFSENERKTLNQLMERVRANATKLERPIEKGQSG